MPPSYQEAIAAPAESFPRGRRGGRQLTDPRGQASAGQSATLEAPDGFGPHLQDVAVVLGLHALAPGRPPGRGDRWGRGLKPPWLATVFEA